MVESTIIGLDVAKQIFQVHGVSADGKVTVKRKLRRSEVFGFFGRLARCIVGLEAVRLVRTSGHARSEPSAMTSD